LSASVTRLAILRGNGSLRFQPIVRKPIVRKKFAAMLKRMSACKMSPRLPETSAPFDELTADVQSAEEQR
jgi:hypothetical protein